MSAPAANVGSIEAKARQSSVEGDRLAVLVALAQFADEAITDPSLAELSLRSGVDRAAVATARDQLAVDRLIELRRATDGRLHVYRFPFADPDREDAGVPAESAPATPPRTRRQIGPIERAARRLDVEGEKRRVLLALAAFVDEGRTDPTVTELSRRCRVHRMAVVVKLDKLARDGVIAIHRGDDRRREKTTYRFLIDTQPERKDPPMTPTKAAPTIPDAHRSHVPHWQRDGWLPDEPVLFEWPELTQLRSRHADIVAALAEAREADDTPAIHAALLEVADFVPEAIATLRRTLPDAEAWFEQVRAEAVPTGKTANRAEQQAQGRQLRELRPKSEAATKALRRAAKIIEGDMFDGDRADTAEPTALIEARHLKAALR